MPRFKVIYAVYAAVIVTVLLFAVTLCSAAAVNDVMMPTIQNGDRIFGFRPAYVFGEPKRGDVVVYTKADGTAAIRRILGMPGETVKLEGGYVYIDGQPIWTDNALFFTANQHIAMPETSLSDDSYFMLGDNRNYEPEFAKRGDIYAKMYFVVNRLKPLTRPNIFFE